MDFLQTLEAHRGGLLHIKSELFWYGERGWDGARGRICLLLDADPAPATAVLVLAALRTTAPADTLAGRLAIRLADAAVAVLLLIDGAPHWVWVCQEDVEIL